MNARRIFAAAAIALASATATACGDGGPTLSNNLADDTGTPRLPDVPPTDTAGFIPPELVP